MLSSASEKLKLSSENFYKNSNLNNSGISLPAHPSRTYLKIGNIHVTPKLVKDVITNLDLSKAPGPDCIPVVLLRNCEPKLSYILPELFNMCLKESCISACCKVPCVIPVLKNVRERSTALLVFFLWLVKYLKDFYMIGLLITSRNMATFLISDMASVVNEHSTFWRNWPNY